MNFIQKWMLLAIAISFLTSPLHAEEQADWLGYQKTCDDQWAKDQNGRHRHVGKAVCGCIADALQELNAKKPVDKNTKEYANFYKQAVQICTTSGIFANTVDRAIFDRVYDKSTIQNLCKSSWVGLMGSFHPVNADFNSAKICECADDELTQIVSNADNLSPKALRLKALAIVRKCDPVASLNSQQFTILDDEAKNQFIKEPSSKGKFSLELTDDPDPKYADLIKYLRTNRRLFDIVDALNQSIKIPHDIKIIAKATGTGPYYVYKERTIYLDYKLMAIALKLYDKNHPLEPAANRDHYINNVNRFFLYHELGHVLIDAYRLPVLGQEEDGADAFSAVISLKYLPKGYLVLLDAADFFNLLDKAAGTDMSSYWDEHGLNKQRYFRLLCFAYGKDPQLVEQKIQHYYQSGLDDFIKDRADYCHDEYTNTYTAWMFLLEPYLNKDVKANPIKPAEEQPTAPN